jgi:hypothetical protein
MKKTGKHHSKHGNKKPVLHHHGKNHFKRGGGVNHGKVDGLPNNDTDHPSQSEHEEAKEYNAQGTHIMKEAHSTKNAFKCGGKVGGSKSKTHFARGGAIKGGTPFSSAYLQENTNSKPGGKAKAHQLRTGLNPGGE